MRRIALVFVLLAIPGWAEAQSLAAPPRWDLGLSAGFFEARPGTGERDGYRDDWYGEDRYAASLGYYWTNHFKTEFEFAHTGEGSRHEQAVMTLPNGQVFYYATENYHRVQQCAARAVWQFLDNQWVAPYVSAGVVVDMDRQRQHAPPQYQWPVDPRTGQPRVVRAGINSERTTEYRGGATIGAGTKFYLSPNAYINTGAVWTYAKPATSISFIAGFGFDF